MHILLSTNQITLTKQEMEEILSWIEQGVAHADDQESESSGQILIENIKDMLKIK